MPSCRVDDVHIALDGLRTRQSTLTEDVFKRKSFSVNCAAPLGRHFRLLVVGISDSAAAWERGGGGGHQWWSRVLGGGGGDGYPLSRLRLEVV
jgi:hypothetical protein